MRGASFLGFRRMMARPRMMEVAYRLKSELRQGRRHFVLDRDETRAIVAFVLDEEAGE